MKQYEDQQLAEARRQERTNKVGGGVSGQKKQYIIPKSQIVLLDTTIQFQA